MGGTISTTHGFGAAGDGRSLVAEGSRDEARPSPRSDDATNLAYPNNAHWLVTNRGLT
jgi:hypothetical protein